MRRPSPESLLELVARMGRRKAPRPSGFRVRAQTNKIKHETNHTSPPTHLSFLLLICFDHSFQSRLLCIFLPRGASRGASSPPHPTFPHVPTTPPKTRTTTNTRALLLSWKNTTMVTLTPPKTSSVLLLLPLPLPVRRLAGRVHRRGGAVRGLRRRRRGLGVRGRILRARLW